MAESVPTSASSRGVQQSTAKAAAREIVRLMHEYTGRGPEKAAATINSNMVVVVLENTMTRGEVNLVDAGQADAVLEMRRTYHSAIRAEAARAIEFITGRTVITVLSDIDVDRDVAIVFFLLDPRPETGVAVTGEAGPEDPAE